MSSICSQTPKQGPQAKKVAQAPDRELGVLVTRPEGQAEGLVSALSNLGTMKVYRLALYTIESPREPQETQRVLRALEGVTLVIFTSVNAVAHAFRLGLSVDMLAGKTVGAVGPTTAGALRERGATVDHVPGGVAGSYGLLSLPALSVACLAGKEVLLVRGHGGRELLHQTLRHRGAMVRHAVVYERKPVDEVDKNERLAQWLPDLDLVVLTSVEGARGLFAGTAPGLQLELNALTYVVASERIAAVVRSGGVNGPVCNAGSAEDQVLAAKVAELCAGRR